MGKLDVSKLKYMTAEDFKALTAVELGRNQPGHQVPVHQRQTVPPLCLRVHQRQVSLLGRARSESVPKDLVSNMNVVSKEVLEDTKKFIKVK